MRRKLTGLIFSLGLACLPLPQAKGQLFGGGVVVCTNCSNLGTQLAERATQLMQYAKEAEAAAQAIQQTQMMIHEGVSLAEHPSTNIIDDLSMLSTIMNQSQSLAGNLALLDQQFRQTYGNYNGPDGLISYSLAYSNWAKNSMKSINGSLQAAGYQSGMLQNEAQWMHHIQTMNQSPLARDQALQLGNTIAVEEVAQLESLRQLMMSDMATKGTLAAQQVSTQQALSAAQQSAFTHANWTADQSGFTGSPQ